MAGTLRQLRRRLATLATRSVEPLARVLPQPAIGLFEWTLRHLSRHLPILSRMVADNMRSAGVYTPHSHRTYFSQIALHMANALRLFGGDGHPAFIRRLVQSQISLDGSVSKLKELMSEGRGVMLAPAHTSNYVLTLARLAEEVPVTIYLRWSKDRRKVELKHHWCRAAGLQVVLEPENAANPTSRAAACVEVLRSGALLAMTPDIAQKRGEGVPIGFLGHSAYLPSGPASIAMLAEVPFVPLFGRISEGIQTLYVTDPIRVVMRSRAEGGRQEAIRLAMQHWANGFAEFLRICPEAWFMWADSRWTRVFRGDPEYSGEPVLQQTNPVENNAAMGSAT